MAVVVFIVALAGSLNSFGGIAVNGETPGGRQGKHDGTIGSLAFCKGPSGAGDPFKTPGGSFRREAQSDFRLPLFAVLAVHHDIARISSEVMALESSPAAAGRFLSDRKYYSRVECKAVWLPCLQ